MSVNGNEETRWRELSPIQLSCKCNYSLITHNKTLVHWAWGLLIVCAACPTPRLYLSSELRPSWKNIQDTSPTGSAQDTTVTYVLILVLIASATTPSKTTPAPKALFCTANKNARTDFKDVDGTDSSSWSVDFVSNLAKFWHVFGEKLQFCRWNKPIDGTL